MCRKYNGAHKSIDSAVVTSGYFTVCVCACVRACVRACVVCCETDYREQEAKRQESRIQMVVHYEEVAAGIRERSARKWNVSGTVHLEQDTGPSACSAAIVSTFDLAANHMQGRVGVERSPYRGVRTNEFPPII